MILLPSNPFIYRLVRAFPLSRLAFAYFTLRSIIYRCHSSAAGACSCLPAFSFSRCGVVQKIGSRGHFCTEIRPVQKMACTIRRFCARSRGEKQAAGRG